MDESSQLRLLFHRLNNQLGIILGFSELLLAGTPSDDPRHNGLEEVHTAATAALDLLERLISGRRRDDGRAPWPRASACVGASCQSSRADTGGPIGDIRC